MSSIAMRVASVSVMVDPDAVSDAGRLVGAASVSGRDAQAASAPGTIAAQRAGSDIARGYRDRYGVSAAPVSSTISVPSGSSSPRHACDGPPLRL